MENWQNEFTYRQNLEFDPICQTIIGYGQTFFECLAWQNYQKQGRGIISISINTSYAEHIRINALSWKSQQSPDLLRIWEHYILVNPLLEANIQNYSSLISYYNPLSEYIVMFTNETQLRCITGFCLWQKQSLLIQGVELDQIDEEAIVQWIETLNEQNIQIETQPIV